MNVLQHAMSGDTFNAVTIVIDFVRLIEVAGSTLRAESVQGVTMQARQLTGQVSRIQNPQGITA